MENIGPNGVASRPTLKLMGIIGLRVSRAETGSQWTYRLQPAAPLCACGCGEQIRLKPQHRCPTKGAPRYIQGHHSTPLRRAYERFRKQGYMFLGEVCRELGISAKVYRRLEVAGKVPRAKRRKGIGGTMVRVFKKKDLARLKAILDSRWADLSSRT
jgi:hypothetical protein